MEVFIEIFETTHPCNDFIFKRMQIRHLVNRWKNGRQLFGYNERMWAQHKPNHQHWSMVLFTLCWNNGIRLAYSSPLERVFVCSGGWWGLNDDGYREAGRNGSCFLHLITVSNWITLEIRKHDHYTTQIYSYFINAGLSLFPSVWCICSVFCSARSILTFI